MATAAMAQINARLDARLKEEGDAALAKAGFTPSEAVRAVWKLAVRYVEKPEKLVAVLDPESQQNELDARATRRHEVAESIKAGSNLVCSAFAESGLDWPSVGDARTYDELKQAAAQEAYGGAMGWEV